MDYNVLKAAISAVIKSNGNNDITGTVLQNSLLTMITAIAANRTYAGYATNSTNPGTPDANVFYIARDSGVYPNFSSLEVNDYEIAVFINVSGGWQKQFINVANALSVKMILEGIDGEIQSFSKASLTTGYYYNLSQGVGNITLANPVQYTPDPSLYGCMRLTVLAGQVITISTIGGNTSRAYALTDNDRKILEVTDSNVNLTGNPATVRVTMDGYLYINCTPSTLNEFFVKVFDSTLLSDIAEIKNDIADIKVDLSAINDQLTSILNSFFEKSVYHSSDLTVGYYYNLSQGIGNITPENPIAYTIDPSLFACIRIPVISGQIFEISTIGGGNSRAYALTDSTRKILQVAASNQNTTTNPVTLTVTQNGYLYINCTPSTVSAFYVNKYTDKYQVQIDQNKNDIILLDTRVYNLENVALDKQNLSNSDLIVGYYYNLSQGVGNVTLENPIPYTVNPTLFGCFKKEIKAGQVITVSTIGGNNSRAYAITDKNRKILVVAASNENTTSVPFVYTALEDGFLFVNCTPTTITNFFTTIYNDISYMIKDMSDRIGNLETIQHSPVFRNNDFPLYKDTLKVLAIGNSFSDDPTAYLDDLLISAGVDRSKCCVYVGVIGGSSLQTWVDKYISNESIDIARRAGTITMGVTTGTLKQIFSQDWDIVVIQQLSSLAIDYSSLNPALKNLRSYIRQDCTNQKICLAYQSVWSYWGNYTENPKGVTGWSDLCLVTKEQINKDGIDIIIPTGTAIQNARGTSLNTPHDITRDGHHLAFGIGRYIAACTWYQVLFAPLFNSNIIGNPSIHTVTQGEKDLSTYEWVDVTNDNKELCQKSAFMAVMDMYNLTTI